MDGYYDIGLCPAGHFADAFYVAEDGVGVHPGEVGGGVEEVVEEFLLAGMTGEVAVGFEEVAVGPGSAWPDLHDFGGERGR